MSVQAVTYADVKVGHLDEQATFRVYGRALDFDLGQASSRWKPVSPCLCVQDSPDNPCPCPPHVWWLRSDMVVAEGDAGRKDQEGNDLRYFDVLLESKIMVETMQSVSAAALKALGANLNARAISRIADPTEGGASALGGHTARAGRVWTEAMRDVQEMVRRKVMQAMVEAAGTDKVSLHEGAVAIASLPDLLVVNAPIAGLETIDFKSMLDGHSVLDGTPVMYWYVAGEALNDRAFPFREGFYSVVADQSRGTVGLRDSRGQTVAQGNLEVCIEPEGTPTTLAKPIISGGITSTSVTWRSIKICGYVKVKEKGVTVTVRGCVSAGF